MARTKQRARKLAAAEAAAAAATTTGAAETKPPKAPVAEQFLLKLAERVAAEEETDDVTPDVRLRAAIDSLPASYLQRALAADFQTSLAKFTTALVKKQHAQQKKRKRPAAQPVAQSFNACTKAAYESLRAQALADNDQALLAALALEPTAPSDILLASVKQLQKPAVSTDLSDVIREVHGLTAALSAEFSAFSSEQSLAAFAVRAYRASERLLAKLPAQQKSKGLGGAIQALAALQQLLSALHSKAEGLTLRSGQFKLALYTPAPQRPEMSLQQAAACALAQYGAALALLCESTLVARISAARSHTASKAGASSDSDSSDDDDDHDNSSGASAAVISPLEHVLNMAAALLPGALPKLHYLLSLCSAVQAHKASLPRAGALLVCEACYVVQQRIPCTGSSSTMTAVEYFTAVSAAAVVTQLMRSYSSLDNTLQARARKAAGAAAAVSAPPAFLQLLRDLDPLTMPQAARPLWSALGSCAGADASSDVSSRRSEAAQAAAVTKELLHGEHSTAAACAAALAGMIEAQAVNSGGTAATTGSSEGTGFYMDSAGLQSLRAGTSDDSDDDMTGLDAALDSYSEGGEIGGAADDHSENGDDLQYSGSE
jgi:hypothetical protein